MNSEINDTDGCKDLRTLVGEGRPQEGIEENISMSLGYVRPKVMK